MPIHLTTYAELLGTTRALVEASDEITSGKATVLNQFLRRSLRNYWRKYWWPELLLVEQRLFRPEYDYATTYAALDEVYYWPTGSYYICVAASTGNPPADTAGEVDTTYWAKASSSYGTTKWAASTAYALGDQIQNIYDGSSYACHTAHTSTSSFDSTKFTLLTPFSRYILLEQTGQTKLGDIQGIYDLNPDVHPDTACKLRHTRRGDRVISNDDAHNVVYIRHRQRLPVLTGDDYNSATAYSSGDTVYYNATDYYTANQSVSAGETPDTDPAKWDLNQIPYTLSQCTAQGAYAEYLFTTEGRSQRAQAQKAYADMLAVDEWKTLDKEGIGRRLPVRTY